MVLNILAKLSTFKRLWFKKKSKENKRNKKAKISCRTNYMTLLMNNQQTNEQLFLYSREMITVY
jgi:hypothetical protein